MGNENVTSQHINFPEVSNNKSDDKGDTNIRGSWQGSVNRSTL